MSRQESDSVVFPEPPVGHASELALILELTAEGTPELGDEERAHIETCARCSERFSAMRQERESFTRSPNATRLRQRLIESGTRPDRAWWPWALGAAAALILLIGGIWLTREPAPGAGAEPSPGMRTKGHQVHWVVVRNGQQFELGPNYAAHSGDRIGWRLQLSKSAYASLVAISERGGIQILLPSASRASLLIPAGKPAGLPLSLRVTPENGATRVFLILSSQPLSQQRLLASAKAALDRLDAGPVDMSALERLDVEGIQGSRLIDLD